jgi:hypothetical protein
MDRRNPTRERGMCLAHASGYESRVYLLEAPASASGEYWIFTRAFRANNSLAARFEILIVPPKVS